MDPILNASPGLEQRKEPRRSAKGKVTVQTPRAEILGQLVDVSESGFRMAHADASLEPGSVFRFHHSEATGEARVVWNRILSGRVETGFLIVSRR
ncbi:MAG: PilZ domain-containing protein [Acidobacteriota bacterium]